MTVVAVFVGAMLQRSTGMGFALVSAPFMILALGPLEGIVLTNVCGALTSFFSAYHLREDFDTARARWLIPVGIVGCVPGALVVLALPPDWVALVVGSIVLVALVVTARAPGGHMRDTPGLRILTGLISGFMNTSAGVGGPAIAVYMRGVGWARRPFAATATAIFGIQGVAAVLLKWHWPGLDVLGWTLMILAVLVGIAAGQALHGRLDDRAAMRVVMMLAFTGTILALAKAIWAVGT